MLRPDSTSRRRPGLAASAALALAAAFAPAGEPALGIDPCSIALVPHAGEERIDREIRHRQERARAAADAPAQLERLGWAFVAKARAAQDPGFYKLAEACAHCIDARRPGAPEAMLLRGHALQNLHRFKEAEALGRELAARRGLWFDHGLLGDALLEQGKLAGAAQAYQAMMDQRPGPQSYCRAAQLRWLKGDIEGAIEAQRMAAASVDGRDAEAAAWMRARLALFELQAGAPRRALALAEEALAFQPDHAPALSAKGRILMAEGEHRAALEPLGEAARLSPLPDALWAEIEALRACGYGREADAVEDRLIARGAIEDPRTLALYLASRGQEPERALALAQFEIEAREDVFTYDALAWASLAAGDVCGAREALARALAEGTEDARLFLHAAAIADAAGEGGEAKRWMARCRAIERLLLPSERERLRRLEESTTRTLFGSVPVREEPSKGGLNKG
jgi:tetratricopeptide (TPR) repeat protein